MTQIQDIKHQYKQFFIYLSESYSETNPYSTNAINFMINHNLIQINLLQVKYYFEKI